MIHWGGFTHLLGPPAAAVDGLVADVLHVEAVHYFGAVFVDWYVDPALGAALWTEVACQQVGAQSRGHCNGNDGGQLICKCTHEEALVFWQGREVPAHYSTSITIFIVNLGQAQPCWIWILDMITRWCLIKFSTNYFSLSWIFGLHFNG